jgi:predicted  nucleic acid-binding Zn-ribbon protein
MTLTKTQRKHLDIQSDLVGIAETIGDKLAATMEATEPELRELLVKELTILQRWQLEGDRSMKEIYERWEKLHEKIADVRMSGVKAAVKEMLADAGTIATTVSKQTVGALR